MNFAEVVGMYGIIIVVCVVWFYILFIVGSFIASYFHTTGMTWWAITIVSMLILGGLTSIGKRVCE